MRLLLGKGGEGGQLGDPRRTDDGRVVHLEHLLFQRLGQHHVADPPAGHGVGLGEGEKVGDVVAELGDRREVEVVPRVLVAEVVIGIVEQDEHAALARDLADPPKLRLAEDRTGRVRRRDQDDRLGPLADQPRQEIEVELPAPRLVEGPEDRRAAAKADLLEMGGEAGVGYDDLVARVDQHVEQGVEALHVARRHHHLTVRIGRGAGGAPVRLGGSLAQRRQTVGQRVFSEVRIAVQEPLNGAADRLGRLERRQTPGQRGYVLHPGRPHGHLLDRGDSHPGNVLGDQGVTFDHWDSTPEA